MKTIAFVGLNISLAANLSASAPVPTLTIEASPQIYCHVHKEKLKHDWVKIRCSLIRLDKDYIEAREKLFPFSNKTWGGGCVIYIVRDAKTGRITRRSPDFKKVDYCTKCRSAEWIWKREKINCKTTSAAKP